MKNTKINVYNWMIGGIMAVTFIVFAKVIFNKWHVPGVSDVVNLA